MTFPTARTVILLLVLMFGTGCSGPALSEDGLSLPTFGAPEQWEPPLEPTPADSKKDL